MKMKCSTLPLYPVKKMDPDIHHPTFFERLSSLLLRAPEDRSQLMQLLDSAHEKKLLDADVLSIIKGALETSEMCVSEVMVPRHKMEVLDIDDPQDEIVRHFLRTGHSRFPVVDGSRDNIIGILLAKDLVRLHVDAGFELRALLRPVVFIPESKRLNVLLREFRLSHNHMAIVIDEYAGVSGLITIEDVLEQIVGEIEDEYDLDEDEDMIRIDRFGAYHVKAQTTIEEFNEALGSKFSDDDCNTVGGLILNHLGRVPLRKEVIDFGGLRFRVLRADGRKLYTLLVQPLPESNEKP